MKQENENMFFSRATGQPIHIKLKGQSLIINGLVFNVARIDCTLPQSLTTTIKQQQQRQEQHRCRAQFFELS